MRSSAGRPKTTHAFHGELELRELIRGSRYDTRVVRSRSTRVDLLGEKGRRSRVIATRISIFTEEGDVTIVINDSPDTEFHLAWRFFRPQSWDSARRAGLC
jgi:hypothetical protein